MSGLYTYGGQISVSFLWLLPIEVSFQWCSKTKCLGPNIGNQNPMVIYRVWVQIFLDMRKCRTNLWVIESILVVPSEYLMVTIHVKSIIAAFHGKKTCAHHQNPNTCSSNISRTTNWNKHTNHGLAWNMLFCLLMFFGGRCGKPNENPNIVFYSSLK